jgi:hypothetical protein
MSDKPEVPQDLREQYERLTKQWHGSTAQKRYANPLLNLIERIARAEARVAELEAENLALSVRSDPVDQLRADVSVLSERNRRLESDLSALRGKVERLTRPVTIDEAEDALNGYYENGGHSVNRQCEGMKIAYGRIVAARAAEGGTHGK